MRAALIVLILAGCCRTDDDCGNNQECSEGQDERMHCYPKDPPPPKRDDLKKRRYTCNPQECGYGPSECLLVKCCCYVTG